MKLFLSYKSEFEAMSNLLPYSTRTKRRKTAAEVCRIIEEVADNVLNAETVDCQTNPYIQLTSSVVSDGDHSSIAAAPFDCFLTDDLCSENLQSSNVSPVLCDCTDCGQNDSETALINDIGEDIYGIEEFNSINFVEDSDWIARTVYESDDDQDYVDNENQEITLLQELLNWSATHKQTQGALSDLLGILQPHLPELPRNARTLKHTQKVYAKCVAGEEYFYFGIRFWLHRLINLI
jgi:hypothetical protein